MLVCYPTSVDTTPDKRSGTPLPPGERETIMTLASELFNFGALILAGFAGALLQAPARSAVRLIVERVPVNRRR